MQEFCGVLDAHQNPKAKSTFGSSTQDMALQRYIGQKEMMSLLATYAEAGLHEAANHVTCQVMPIILYQLIMANN